MCKYLRLVVLFLLILNGTLVSSQNEFSLGIEVSPSVKLQTIRNKVTGLFTSFSGYGFNLGLPIKYSLEDNRSISFGVLYEFTAFDNRVNTMLVNALRLNTVSVPLVYNYSINENYYVNMGGGVNYVFKSREYGGGLWTNVNEIVNPFQPYLCFGGSMLQSRQENIYEIGVNARCHILNLWRLNTSTSINIVSLDLNLKYFF